MSFKPELLVECVNMKMPFGKYEGRYLCDLPISYLEWFKRKGGFPKGKIGVLLETVYEIKLNGLDEILFELKRRFK
ncbi:DUF3820 family protein [Cryomorphaceae bacterium 1068]|nr:DUF3820 family protein [Cryomorphaceae bacterium 1068]